MAQLLTKPQYVQFFVPTNRTESKMTSLFDGRYTLTVESYKTCADDAPHKSWKYTRGLIRNAEGEEIFDVHRNYSPFLSVPFTHNGCDYLVVGVSYMEGTLLNLTQRTAVPIRKDEFCFASGSIVDLAGCSWGASYEHRFYRVVPTPAGDTLEQICVPLEIADHEKEVLPGTLDEAGDADPGDDCQ